MPDVSRPRRRIRFGIPSPILLHMPPALQPGTAYRKGKAENRSDNIRNNEVRNFRISHTWLINFFYFEINYVRLLEAVPIYYRLFARSDCVLLNKSFRPVPLQLSHYNFEFHTTFEFLLYAQIPKIGFQTPMSTYMRPHTGKMKFANRE